MDLAQIDPGALALILGALAVGSFAKGITGIGLPVIAVPLMAAFIGVEEAVVVMVLPTLVSNLWLIWAYRRSAPSTDRLRGFLLLGVAGAAAGTWLLANASPRALSLLLALWLAAYLLVLLRGQSVSLPKHPAFGPVIGLVAGTIQGATGISAPIIAPYLTGIGLLRGGFVFTITLAFTLFSLAQIAAILHYGLLTPARLVESMAAILPVALFMPLGIAAGRRLSERGFQIWLFLLLALIEIRLLYDGLWNG